MIKGNPEYTLLDDQIVAYNKVLHHARRGYHAAEKTVLIINGGPGTGKSLIAVNVMATLADKGFNTQHATGSKAFTENLRKVVGSRAGAVFKYFNSFVSAEPNAVDVLICDEAHRIRKTSNNRYTPKVHRSSREQVEEIIDAAKVSVFLIDDKQVVRPEEIGSAELIREAATRFDALVDEEHLHTQFRCAGSEAFVSWVEGCLAIGNSDESMFESTDAFEFRIVDSPTLLDELIRARIAERYSARVTAGFCWPWSNPRADGSLIEDVVIDTRLTSRRLLCPSTN